MTKNSAVLAVTFGLLTFCSFGRAQDQVPTIDTAIALVRAEPLNDESRKRRTLINGCRLRRSCHTKAANRRIASGNCQKKPSPTGLDCGFAA